MTDVTPRTVPIPGYVAGTWDIDPVHSDVSFFVRHLTVSKVRGRFTRFGGTVRTDETLVGSDVTATVDASSIDTGSEQRDNHLRSADFFEVDTYPTWSFQSTGLRAEGEDYFLDGDLTIKGTSRPVSFDLEVNGFTLDGMGGVRAGFSASTTIDRNDYGVDIKMTMDGGGLIVGDKVHIGLEIQAVLRS